MAASSPVYDLIVIGGGAAGFFGAINVAERKPTARILILEKSTKLLSKVSVSGGGRCNVTHSCFSPSALSQHYPRGEKQLKKIFHEFQAEDVVEWFHRHGVTLKTEEDGRMFPDTDSSETIINCFLQEAQQHKIEIKTSAEVARIKKMEGEFLLSTSSTTYRSKNVLVAAGGYNKKDSYNWVGPEHEIIDPIPSLFTFNDSTKDFVNLMGVAVANAEVKIAATKFAEKGAVLITHWGLSGPAVIKLSAWAAEYLHQKHYSFTALVNWSGLPEAEARNSMNKLKESGSKKQIYPNALFELPKRLWEHLCTRAEIAEDKIWAEVSNKSINRLTELLTACPFQIKGKTTFKEEFVTCGGVSLNDVDITDMQSKKQSGLYFAGEILHIDGETGGFNFQAAWSTAWLAARSIAAT